MGSRWEQQPGGSDGPLPPSWSFDPYTPSPSPGDPHAGRSAEHPPGPGARGSDPDSSAPGTVGRARGAARTVGRGAAATGRATAKASVAGARLVGRGTKAGTARFRAFAGKDGARNSGLAGLTEVHAVAAAGDAAFTIALASTVLALPVGQARGQVAIFLATTMAPFVLLGPFVGPLLDRFRHGRRWAIGGSLAVRAFLSWGLAGLLDGSAWLLPVALLCLVATRAYAVARSAGMPLVLPPGVTLVTANARTSIAGIIGMVLGSALAAPVSRVGPEWTLRLTFAIYAVATVLAVRLPAAVDSPPPGPEEGAPEPLLTGWRRRPEMPGRVRATLAVTSGSRVLAGFLTLFLAFLLQEQPLAGLSPLAALGLVVGVAGLGNGVGSFAGNRWGDLAPGRIAGSMLGLVRRRRRDRAAVHPDRADGREPRGPARHAARRVPHRDLRGAGDRRVRGLRRTSARAARRAAPRRDRRRTPLQPHDARARPVSRRHERGQRTSKNRMQICELVSRASPTNTVLHSQACAAASVRKTGDVRK